MAFKCNFDTNICLFIAALDTSATETEDETIKLGINTGPVKRTKTRRKRKERDKPDKVSRKVKKDVEKKVRKIKANNSQTPVRRRQQNSLRRINQARRVGVLHYLSFYFLVLKSHEFFTTELP